MRFFVYNKDFSNREEVAHAISISTSSFYNGIGKMTIVLPINRFNIDNLKNGCLVFNEKTKEAFIIVNTEIDTKKETITVNGYTADSLLNQRIILNESKIVNVEPDVYSAINQNLRGLSNIKTADIKGIECVVDGTIPNGQLADECIKILDSCDLGHRMIWDEPSKTLTFEIYKGQDKTQGIHSSVFSYENGTAKSLVISDDISVEKNTYYISGELKDGTRITEVVGDENKGNGRSEKWINVLFRQMGDVTEEQFRNILKYQAVIESVKNSRRQNFNVEIDTRDFGKYFSLGDVISCVSTSFGVKFNSRITGVRYMLDANGEKMNLTLGEPKITILEEMRLNG